MNAFETAKWIWKDGLADADEYVEFYGAFENAAGLLFRVSVDGDSTVRSFPRRNTGISSTIKFTTRLRLPLFKRRMNSAFSFGISDRILNAIAKA